MRFASREEAGCRLAEFLQRQQVQVDLVAGLPRGGVVVAAAVARILQRPLDVLIVRKIGHPLQREFAIGALAEQAVVVLDEDLLGPEPSLRTQLQSILAEEARRLQECRRHFLPPHPVEHAGKAILIVDDGLATGATAEAAARCARRKGARWIVVAAPVASPAAVARLAPVADEVRVLHVDPDFDAVGRYYRIFAPTSDAEVQRLLRES